MSGALKIRYLATAERDNPDLGVLPKDDRLRKLGYRILIIRKYLVFYVVKNDAIQIRRVLHGARQFAFLL